MTSALAIMLPDPPKLHRLSTQTFGVETFRNPVRNTPPGRGNSYHCRSSSTPDTSEGNLKKVFRDRVVTNVREVCPSHGQRQASHTYPSRAYLALRVLGLLIFYDQVTIVFFVPLVFQKMLSNDIDR